MLKQDKTEKCSVVYAGDTGSRGKSFWLVGIGKVSGKGSMKLDLVGEMNGKRWRGVRRDPAQRSEESDPGGKTSFRST